MSIMRAKFKIDSITLNGYQETLKFSAVYGGSLENNTYSAATPCAQLSMDVSNKALHGQFKPGQEFYVDFTLAE